MPNKIPLHPLYHLSLYRSVYKTRLQVSKIPRMECQTISLTFVSVRKTKSADFPIVSGLVSFYQTKPAALSKMCKGEF